MFSKGGRMGYLEWDCNVKIVLNVFFILYIYIGEKIKWNNINRAWIDYIHQFDDLCSTLDHLNKIAIPLVVSTGTIHLATSAYTQCHKRQMFKQNSVRLVWSVLPSRPYSSGLLYSFNKSTRVKMIYFYILACLRRQCAFLAWFLPVVLKNTYPYSMYTSKLP